MRAHFAGLLIFAMILLTVLDIVNPGLFSLAAGACAWLAGALIATNISNFQRVQVALMLVIGASCIVGAETLGDPAWGRQLLIGNHAMLAMLAAVTFLRLVTRTPRDSEENPRGPYALWQTLLAVHLFGAIINFSAALIIGHRISARQGRLTALQAQVISRGFVAAATWSPLFASMAVVLAYIPGVNFLKLISFNIFLAAALILYTGLRLQKNDQAEHFEGFPVHRDALTVPVILSAVAICLTQLPAQIPVLPLLVLACLLTVLILAPFQGLRAFARRAREHVITELPKMNSEFALFLAAAVLATGITALASVGVINVRVDPSSAADGIIIMISVAALSLIGIHPVISVAVLAGLLVETLSDPDLIAIAVLAAWATTLCTAPLSGFTLTMQSRFGIASTEFFKWNAGYTVIGLAMGSIMLLIYALVIGR